MEVKVTEKEVLITKPSIINEGELCVNKCFFSFPESFGELQITAFFNSIPVPVSSDNVCYIPSLKMGNAVLGVCAYKTKDDEMRLIYSPKPAVFWVGEGSFTDEYTNEEIPEISRYEEYCRMLLEKSGNKSDYANAIKGFASGEFLTIDDISPVVHRVKFSIDGEVPENVGDVKLYIYGKNLLDKANLLNGFLSSNGSVNANLSYFRCFEGFLPAGKYTLSINEGATKLSFSNALVNGTYSAINSIGVEKYTINIPVSGYVKFTFRKADSSAFSGTEKIQLERGEKNTEYEECVCKQYGFNQLGIAEAESFLCSSLNAFCESSEVSLRVEYNRDINKLMDNLSKRLEALEGE